MKKNKFYLATIISVFLFLNTLKGQHNLDTKNINGCEKILMTLGNLEYLVNTSVSAFGASVSKFDYERSTNSDRIGEYTDGKNNGCSFMSVLNRYDENLNKNLTYFTGDETICTPMKRQLEQMKGYYEGSENGIMKFTYSHEGKKYSLFVKFASESNTVRIVQEP